MAFLNISYRRWRTQVFVAGLALGFTPRARALEFNIFPIVGGDSDVGLGAGQVSDVARLGAVPEKYLWKLESGAFVTVKPQNGALSSRSRTITST